MRPTPRAIWLLAAGVPVALLPSLALPRAWPLLLIFWGGAFFVCGLDALLAPRRQDVRWKISHPDTLYIGEPHQFCVSLSVRSSRLVPVQARLDVSDELAPPASVSVTATGEPGMLEFELVPRRRGNAKVESLWIRTVSPLGLWCRVVRETLDTSIPVLSNLPLVRSLALRFFADRSFRTGLKIERYRGDGTEFDSLKEHLQGDDPRTIDWKTSARHRQLLSRQFRAERNHQIILAVDTGHLMSEPLDGIPRLDHALNSALLLAYVCLRSGDRVGLFTFDGRVGPGTEPLAGISSMAALSLLTSRIDYSSEETNFTLGLTTLMQRLRRRSLVILLTDFVDTVTAELMLGNLVRLGGRHLVVFVSIRDPLLSTLEAGNPASIEGLSRAVVSRDFLQDRELVHGRLRRRGIQTLDVEPAQIGPALINRYLDIKRRELV